MKARFRPIDGGGVGGETGGQSGTGGTTGVGGVSGDGGDTGSGGAVGTDGGSDDADVGGQAGMGAGGAGMGGSGSGGMGTGGAGGSDAGSDSGGLLDAGSDGPPPPSAAGQLVITEIMVDTEGPPDESGEWFEVYNPTSQTFDLFGCLLFDTSTVPGNSDTVGRHILIAPGEYKTMARFGDLGGGFNPTYNYHTTLTVGGVPDPNRDVKLDNSGDQVGITCGTTVIDIVNFATWVQPIPPATAPVVPHGRAYSLDPTHLSATDNDVRDNWCTAVPVYPLPSGPDHGTPGVANPPCACPSPTLFSCLWNTPP